MIRSREGSPPAGRGTQRELLAQELARDVRQAMPRLDDQGLYPSGRRIRPLMHRRIHPLHADFYVIRRILLQEPGWTLDPSAYQQDVPDRREATQSP
ncbi:MAG: hypothetical protein M0Z94_17875 [Dehalococcoidales bacterium]|nr:hypothetical protein [Dehalococcoidales bacterium]